MAFKSSAGSNSDRGKKSSLSDGNENNSSESGLKESQSESHLFGRMSKKLAQLARLNRSDSTTTTTTTTTSTSTSTSTSATDTNATTSKRQQIENLERQLDEWKQRDIQTQKLLSEEATKRQATCDKLQSELEQNRSEYCRVIERLRHEHCRQMERATLEWSDLEANFRRQIDELNVECAQAVSELTRLKQTPPTTFTDKNTTTNDATNDPENANCLQVTKFNEQLDELRLEMEVHIAENHSLKEQLENLQSQLDDANNSLVTLAITLSELREEHDTVQQNLHDCQQEAKRLNDDNDRLIKTQNSQKHQILQLDADKINSDELIRELSHSIVQMKRKMETMERKLETAEINRVQLEADYTERQNVLTKNLVEAIEAKKIIEQKYEFLRNCNTEREHQLLNDYEWKLREIEKGCKNQTEKLKEVQNKLKEEKEKIIEEKTSQANEMQKCEEKVVVTEAELRQLRGFSSELQKGMKAASVQVDQMRLLELRLRDELRDTKSQLQEAREATTRLQTELAEAKAVSERRLKAKEVTLKYGHDERIKEIAIEWEKKLKDESVKIKNDLEAQYAQQKILDLQELSLQKDEEMAEVIHDYEQRFQTLTNEVTHMTSELENTEKQLTDEIYLTKMASNTKTNDLQRRLEARENDYLKNDAELKNKEKQLEDLQMQLAAHRATLDLVRDEVARNKDDEIDQLKNEQERQLANVTNEYEDKLQETLEIQLQSHKAQIQMARVELEKTLELATEKQKDHRECIDELKDALNERDAVIGRLNDEVQRLQTGLSKMSAELDFHGREILRVRHEASRQLRLATTNSEDDSNKVDNTKKDLKEENINVIRQLKEALLDKDRLVKKLQEEKRSLQTELSHRMDHYKRLSTSQPVVGANTESMSVPKRNKRFNKDPSKRLSAPILRSPLLEDLYAEAIAEQSTRSREYNGRDNKRTIEKIK